MHGWGSRAPVPVLALRPASLSIPQAERDSHHNLVNAQRAGQGAPSILLRQIPIQPASGLNSSLSATLAGRVNFAALLLCLVFVIISHSHAPSAAFRLVLGSCVMRVPTRQSITYSAKDLCIVRSVDYPRLSVVARRNVVPPSGCRAVLFKISSIKCGSTLPAWFSFLAQSRLRQQWLVSSGFVERHHQILQLRGDVC